MERLTEREGIFVKSKFKGEYASQNILARLAEYEDAEEQGLLLKLPCKVGTTVYYLNRAKGKVREAKVWKMGLLYDNKGAIYVDEKDMCFSFEALGKFWFLTREEAEQALAEMQKG